MNGVVFHGLLRSKIFALSFIPYSMTLQMNLTKVIMQSNIIGKALSDAKAFQTTRMRGGGWRRVIFGSFFGSMLVYFIVIKLQHPTHHIC